MIEKLNIKIHFTKISSAKGIKILNSAKDKGLPITYDVSINNLLLNDTLIEDFDTNTNLVPPIRSKGDQMAIINELIEMLMTFRRLLGETSADTEVLASSMDSNLYVISFLLL